MPRSKAHIVPTIGFGNIPVVFWDDEQIGITIPKATLKRILSTVCADRDFQFSRGPDSRDYVIARSLLRFLEAQTEG